MQATITKQDHFVAQGCGDVFLDFNNEKYRISYEFDDGLTRCAIWNNESLFADVKIDHDYSAATYGPRQNRQCFDVNHDSVFDHSHWQIRFEAMLQIIVGNRAAIAEANL